MTDHLPKPANFPTTPADVVATGVQRLQLSSLTLLEAHQASGQQRPRHTQPALSEPSTSAPSRATVDGCSWRSQAPHPRIQKRRPWRRRKQDVPSPRSPPPASHRDIHIPRHLAALLGPVAQAERVSGLGRLGFTRRHHAAR